MTPTQGPPADRAALCVEPVTGLPEVVRGTDLAALLAPALAGRSAPLAVVVSSKVISKALGLQVPARDKDRAIDGETQRVVAERSTAGRVTRIVEAKAGPVMAAAGVDASNVGSVPLALLLPHDADSEARWLRQSLLTALDRGDDEPLAVIVSDTAGRAWRSGVTDFALGCAGLVPLLDHRGEQDADGRALSLTVRCPADEIAAAADLVKGKVDGIPAAVVTGLPAAWFAPDAPGARTIVRTGAGDWFALGHVEAVRSALGVPPGSRSAARVGIPGTGGLDDLSTRCRRALALALDDEQVGVDVLEDDESTRVTPSGPEYPVGRFVGRLEVAAWAESVTVTVGGDGGLRLSDAGAAGWAGVSAVSSEPHDEASSHRPR